MNPAIFSRTSTGHAGAAGKLSAGDADPELEPL